MGNPVMIKGNKYGFVLVLDEQLDFILLRREIAAKFKQSNRFFNASSQVAIRFEGRKLSEEEKNLVLETIEETTNLNIILEEEKEWEDNFGSQRPEQEETVPTKTVDFPLVGRQEYFYKGTLMAGQSIEVRGGITLLGDIKKGATVTARGNVIVLGEIEGKVIAGYPSNSHCCIVALNMNPTQLRIGKIFLYEKKRKKQKVQIDDSQIKPKFAFVEKGSMHMELLEKNYRYKMI